jgi:hypothetical protein
MEGFDMSGPSKEEIAVMADAWNELGERIGRLEDENERLRAELVSLGEEYEVMRQWNVSREDLRAERAECLALLEDIVRNRIGREFPSLATDAGDLLVKLRGQQP